VYYARLWALDAVSALRWTVTASDAADLRILLYHDIVDLAPQDDPLRISVAPALFERHIRLLRDAGYRFVSVQQAAADLAAGTPPARAVIVTFDDAHVSMLTEAVPILKRYGVPATLFVPSAWIGKDRFPWIPAGAFTRPMTWDELESAGREIDLEIGSHTATHRVLHERSAEEQRAELEGSKRTLEDRLGRPVRVFAYPFGGWNTFPAAVQRVLGDVGYVAACTNVMGKNGAGANPLALHRVRIGWHDVAWRFRMKLAGAYDWSDRVRMPA